jgi:general secretion pathway protein E
MNAPDVTDARRLVDRLLEQAVRQRASDLHVEPIAGGYDARLRIDGVLQPVQHFDTEVGRGIVSRLMVMAQLLTYRLDIPQEGRLQITAASENRPLELRVAVIPTTHGLRAAVRLPAELVQPRRLEQLELPPQVLEGLQRFARGDAGMLILTGPAGSGKTTTIYALLEHLAQTQPGVSIISLEDPVERDIAGVTQIEVSPFGQLTYERALKSILRQDPQVLMLGEIRDAATASLAVQTALSGHRLICTLHAADPAGAIARLVEMGLEAHQINSAVHAVVSQRLLRRRGEEGYSGRVPVAEIGHVDGDVRQAVLARGDAGSIRIAFQKQGTFVTMREVAGELVARGVTDMAEVERVLGPDEKEQPRTNTDRRR